MRQLILDVLAINHFSPCVTNPQTNHVRLGFIADQTLPKGKTINILILTQCFLFSQLII